MNMRLLLGIVILVLGILILVNSALLPLIAGIALIVIGLWIALQNASGARPWRRPTTDDHANSRITSVFFVRFAPLVIR